MELVPLASRIEEQISDELERGICGIFGVRGARVVLDPVGDIVEVHVVVSPKRSPKKVVRDIETYFAVRQRRRIDYRRISCVQLRDDIPLQDRPTLRRIASGPDHVEIILSDGTHQLLGRSAVEGQPLRAGALATVAALNQLWNDDPRLALMDAQTLPIGQRELGLIYLTYTGRSIEHLTGTSFIRGERSEAGARAVLAAVNRRLRTWLAEPQLGALVAEDR